MSSVTSPMMEINFDSNVLVSAFCLINSNLVYLLRYEEILPKNIK